MSNNCVICFKDAGREEYCHEHRHIQQRSKRRAYDRETRRTAKNLQYWPDLQRAWLASREKLAPTVETKQ
jgi:hypothetical protein